MEKELRERLLVARGRARNTRNYALFGTPWQDAKGDVNCWPA